MWRKNEESFLLPKWDYIPPPEVILYSINYPATVATEIAMKPHTLQIGLEYSLGGFIVYIAFIAMLWFFMGWFLERPRDGVRAKKRLRWGIPIAIIFAIFFGMFAQANKDGGYLVIYISGITWCLVLIALPIWRLITIRASL